MQIVKPVESFQARDVVNAYLYRPDYPGAIYARLIEISMDRGCLLDLGCDTGKIARRLCRTFQSITAIDASEAMLQRARSLTAGNASNINWMHGEAEAASFAPAAFDMVVAAGSIHWMDHAVLFPRLASSVSSSHVFAAIAGDEPFSPPWQSQWDAFLRQWIYELKGEVYEPGRPDSAFSLYMNGHRAWIDIAGELTAYSDPIQQSIEHFIACQHSRGTFSSARLGARFDAFDQQQRHLLEPYAVDGVLTFTIASEMVWGRIKC